METTTETTVEKRPLAGDVALVAGGTRALVEEHGPLGDPL